MNRGATLFITLIAGLLAAADPVTSNERRETKTCWDGSVIPVHSRCPRPNLDPFVIFFEPGSAEIAPSSVVILSNVAQAYRMSNATALIVDGHSDPAEPPTLARRRAESVRAYLEGLDIPPNAMTVQSFGANRMLLDAPDSFARRVDVYFPLPFYPDQPIAIP